MSPQEPFFSLACNISLSETMVCTAAYHFIFRSTCPWRLSYISCDKMYSSWILLPFCSLYVPSVAVYVIPNCWQLAEVGNILLAVLKQRLALYLSYMFLRISSKLSPSLFYLCSIQFNTSTWAVVPVAVQTIHNDFLYQWVSALLRTKQTNKNQQKPKNTPQQINKQTSLQYTPVISPVVCGITTYPELIK